MHGLDRDTDPIGESRNGYFVVFEVLAKLHGGIFTGMVNSRQAPFSPIWRWPVPPIRRSYGMGNRIRELRENLGLTLEQVAEVAETSGQQIARLETGGRRLTDDWMRRIAPALGVLPAALLSNQAPDIIKVVKEPKKFRLRPDEIRLISFWRKLDLTEKRMIAAFARSKGLEILADDSEARRA